jgi:MFS superfamily sulfate permease-like transporter
MYFGNAQHIADTAVVLIHAARPGVVLLDCAGVPDVEYTALGVLMSTDEHLQRDGIARWFAALSPMALEVVQRSPLGERLGRERRFFIVHQAVEAYLATRQAGNCGSVERPRQST